MDDSKIAEQESMIAIYRKAIVVTWLDRFDTYACIQYIFALSSRESLLLMQPHWNHIGITGDVNTIVVSSEPNSV